jgi:hypothetical protein
MGALTVFNEAMGVRGGFMQKLVFCAFVIAVLLPNPARADDGEDNDNEGPPNPMTLLGWTADSASFAYTYVREIGESNMMPDGSTTVQATMGYVVDAHSGVVTEVVIEKKGKLTKAERKQLAAGRGVKDWKTWTAAHPTACKMSRTSPDGRARAEVSAQGKNITATWADGAFEWGPAKEDSDVETEGVLLFQVKRDGATFTSAIWKPEQGGHRNLGQIQTCWSPDGRRVAWIAYHSPMMMRDFGYTEILLGPAGGPRIELRADKTILEKVVAPVGAALEKAGFYPTAARPADEARPKTIVYTVDATRAVAARVAEAVPGGATVERITWKAPKSDIIVAIGASALK